MNKKKISKIFYLSSVMVFIIYILFILLFFIKILNIDKFSTILYISHFCFSIFCLFIWNKTEIKTKEILVSIEYDCMPNAKKEIKDLLSNKKIDKKEYQEKKYHILDICLNYFQIQDDLKDIVKTGRIITIIALSLYAMLLVSGKEDLLELYKGTEQFIFYSIIPQLILLLFSVILIKIMEKKPNFA